MTVIVSVAQCKPQELDELFATRELVIAIGEGELRGCAAAAALFAGWSVLSDDARVHLDTPVAWAGAAWRIGNRAYELWLDGTAEFDANAARREGLCDEVAPAGFDAAKWISTRSELALDSATALIQQRGGDAVEGVEFARLFAAGEPQEGLRAFLEKRTPRFSRSSLR
jgi:hypothetical protein